MGQTTDEPSGADPIVEEVKHDLGPNVLSDKEDIKESTEENTDAVQSSVAEEVAAAVPDPLAEQTEA